LDNSIEPTSKIVYPPEPTQRRNMEMEPEHVILSRISAINDEIAEEIAKLHKMASI
jgi:hypothetical protein